MQVNEKIKKPSNKGKIHLISIGAFKKFRKGIIEFVMFVRPSIWNSCVPNREVLQNFILENFSKIRENSSFFSPYPTNVENMVVSS